MAESLRVERNKRAGVHYAFTDDGIELPIIDITHPAFALSVSRAEQERLTQDFMREQRQLAKIPVFLREPLLRLVLRGSVLAGALRQAKGKFLTGLSTYLFKLGPENLGRAYTKPIDRKIASTLPTLGMRLRLQDHAELLGDVLFPQLRAAAQRPLWLFNIAGGPAFDSINALILLLRKDRSVLDQRKVVICVLDGDSRGPAFGARALCALQRPSGPLHGTTIEFERRDYDWRDPSALAPPLTAASAAGAICALSSEGGLFEYGSDDDILANLRALHAAAVVPSIVGSVTRCDEPMRLLRAASVSTNAAAIQPRGLSAFRALAARAGYGVARVIERPFGDNVLLVAS